MWTEQVTIPSLDGVRIVLANEQDDNNFDFIETLENREVLDWLDQLFEKRPLHEPPKELIY